MKTICVSVCLVMAAAAAAVAAPPIPNTPAAVTDVVYARPFALNDGFRYDWCNEPFQVSQGTILVLRVDPRLVIPRQIGEPVLYVGNQAAMRLNQGDQSGYVIAVVPGQVELTKDLVWFGTPEMPENVNAARVQAERQQAEKAGIKPLSAEKVKAATDAGGTCINARDMSGLLRDTIGKLVEQYSPQEKELVEAWRLPVTKPAGAP
jgi:hypothetical protein